jgi:hypothetical protein
MHLCFRISSNFDDCNNGCWPENPEDPRLYPKPFPEQTRAMNPEMIEDPQSTKPNLRNRIVGVKSRLRSKPSMSEMAISIIIKSCATLRLKWRQTLFAECAVGIVCCWGFCVAALLFFYAVSPWMILEIPVFGSRPLGTRCSGTVG